MLRIKKIAEKLLTCSLVIATFSTCYIPRCHIILGDGKLDSQPDDTTGRRLMQLLKNY